MKTKCKTCARIYATLTGVETYLNNAPQAEIERKNLLTLVKNLLWEMRNSDGDGSLVCIHGVTTKQECRKCLKLIARNQQKGGEK